MKDDLCKDYETKHKKNIDTAGKVLSVMGGVFTLSIGYILYKGSGTQNY
jgi:hypothetical protein